MITINKSKILTITHKGKEYNLDAIKVIGFLNVVKFSKNEAMTDEEIIDCLKKHHLMDEIFLENVNKLY